MEKLNWVPGTRFFQHVTELHDFVPSGVGMIKAQGLLSHHE